MARIARFTVYDMMDAKGFFDTNPANTSSKDSDGRSMYAGPVEYPKMLYHPKGEMVVTQAAEIIVTPMGPKEVNEKRELISRVVNNKQEELLARQEGWHLHPSDAVVAGGGKAPAKSAQQILEEQQKNQKFEQEQAEAHAAAQAARIAELEAQLKAMATPSVKNKLIG